MEENMYRIETMRDGMWTADGMGDERRRAYSTRAEAEASIENLRTCGPDWRDADYRVVEVA